MPNQLDGVDRKILKLLQADAKVPNTRLAEEVGLSPSPCLRRVKLLEEAGIISRYVALLNPGRIGLGMTIFVRVTLERQDQESVEGFAAEMQKLPQVVEAHLMAGTYDYLLRVVVSDLWRAECRHRDPAPNHETDDAIARLRQSRRRRVYSAVPSVGASVRTPQRASAPRHLRRTVGAVAPTCCVPSEEGRRHVPRL